MVVIQKVEHRVTISSSNLLLRYMSSVQKVSSHVLWQIETFIEEDIRNIVHRTMTPQSLHSCDLLEEISGSLASVWMNFAMTCFMPRSCIIISNTVVLESSGQLLVLALSVTDLCLLHPVHIQHSQVFSLLQAFQNVDHFQQILKHLWSICATILFALHSNIDPESLLNHLNCFHGGMFKLNAKFDEDSFFYSLSHFECDSHTVDTLTQWHLPSPLTSTVKSLLFTHAHSSPLSLATSLHWCHTNCSPCINNGWSFSG